MKYIFNCIFITILGFLNIGNCFAGSADWSLKGTIYNLIIPIFITIVGLFIYHFFFLPIKEIDDFEEQENKRKCPCNIKQEVRNYINTEGKALIEKIIFKSFEKSETKKIIGHIVSEIVSEKKAEPSPQKTKTKEQSQFVNTQTVNQGYADKDSKATSIHSELAQQQAVALEQTAMTETHSEASDRLTIKYARETNNSFTLRDIKDTYQKGKSLYKLTIYSDNITARIEPLLERDEVKQRALNDEGKLLEPICEIEKASDKPKDIKLISSGSAKLEDGNWVVDDKHKIRIKFE